MQIFLPSDNLHECAKALDDKRLNKIIVESAQIASTAIWINDCDLAETLVNENKIYLPTHEYHPLCKWASHSYLNYNFTTNYCLFLCMEYSMRFHKKHTTFSKWPFLSMVLPTVFKDFNQTNPINATTNHKHITDIYEAYRLELLYKWKTQKTKPVWTNRKQPEWFLK